MASYLGRHAELYDLFYKDKPYSQEAAFVDQCLRAYSSIPPRRLLELACGTGSHSFHLERKGYEITATDYSSDMLSRAREKAIVQSSTVEFSLQDMRQLETFSTPFDAAICLFDSFGYVLTNDAITRTLQGLSKNLKTGGLFVVEFWHAGAMLRHYDPLRVARWKVAEGEILRISETSIDWQQSVAHVTYSIYELHDEGNYRFLKETQSNRCFLTQEMSNLLHQSGFEPLKWFAGFTENESITDQTWHIVAVARKE